MNTIELIAMYATSPVTVALSSVFVTMGVHLVLTIIKRQWDKTLRLEEEIGYSEHRVQQNVENVLEELVREEEIRERERAKFSGQVFDELIGRQMKSIESKGLSEGRAIYLEKTVSDIDTILISAVKSSDSIANSIPGMRNELVDEVPSLVEDLKKSANMSEQNSVIVNRMENSTTNLRHHLQATKSRLSSINGAFGGGN